MTERDWVAWHEPYADPESPLSRRLRIVQRRIVEVLDRQPPGPIRVVSLCAGQGRDLIGALADHPRRDDVSARLVELDPVNAGVARDLAASAGLSKVDVVTGDAAAMAAYAGAVPADLVLACGVFGNVSHAHIRRTIGALPQLCTEGATVIWTRHRREPDLTPTVRGWFAEAGFEELAFDAPEGESLWISVGTHRFRGVPAPFDPELRMFEFVADPIAPS
jgi:hypothetical protein